MQQVLFVVIFSEMVLIMVLLFKTPLRKLVIMGIDRVKRGRGPVVVKAVAGTMSVVLGSSVYSVLNIQKRWIDDGLVNPTDQVLMAKHLLEATLMGASLFLALMIDRLHHYLRELRILRKSMEAVKKQTRSLEDGKAAGSLEEIKVLEEEVTTLLEKSKKLEKEIETKKKEVNVAELSAVALRKQSEGFLLEYDRLLEENQNLRSSLQSLDWRASHSKSKKNT
ncbi:hypothetical protein LWI29_029385 [Acer saccharum]|uniref:Endoplasmic reticulum transmembrane protein n=1 Tax=Acer saccharum TaxID=4024 RepID=A0AA39VH60_ACESA|nr:hypothetical protein LWI29_029385 [Acer saccharum]KAK1557084.1 hypothetical protein Q3G72_017571 [Acer saccharum]